MTEHESGPDPRRHRPVETDRRWATHEWMQSLFTALRRRSAWGPFLEVRDLDVLDTLQAPILLSLLHSSSSSRQAVRAPRWKRLGPAVRARRRALGNAMEAARHSARLAPADLVCWPVEPDHVESQLPVARELERNGLSVTFVTNRPHIALYVAAQGRTVTLTSRHWPWLPLVGRNLARRTIAATRRAPRIQLASRARPTTDVAIERIRTILQQLLPGVLQAAVASDLLIETVRPRGILVGNDLTQIGRTVCRTARRRGLPTVQLMHGVYSNNPLSAHHIVDRLLVYGPEVKRELVEKGADGDRIVATGAPHLDVLPRPTGKIDTRLRQALSLRRQAPYVLIALSGPGNSVSHTHHRQLARVLAAVTTVFPEVDFVVRLHRKDDPSYYHEAAARVPHSRLRVVRPQAVAAAPHLSAWLNGCLALVTGASASALEAMLMDVPVVSLDLRSEVSNVGFVSSGAAYHATSEGELVQRLRAILGGRAPSDHSHRVEDFLSGYLGERDGRAASRAAASIHQLIERSEYLR